VLTVISNKNNHPGVLVAAPVSTQSANGSWNLVKVIPSFQPSEQQSVILNHITQEKQTRTLVHAGGGVGKTTIIDILGLHFTHENTLNLACFGSAAALLKNGATFASIVMPSKFSDSNYTKHARKIHGHLLHVVWDEFGCGNTRNLIDLEKYCRIVKRSNKPWGDISITICGDCLQTAPVTGINIVHADVGRYNISALVRTQVQNLLRPFTIFTESDLSVVERNDGCPEHLLGCHEFRTLPDFLPGESNAKQLQYTPEETQAFVPLSNTTIQHLMREITAEEMKTQLWMDAVIICTSNRERAMFNLQAAVRKATTDGVPVAAWKEPFHENGSDPFYSSRLHDMKRHPETFGFHVPDSPGMVLHNIVRNFKCLLSAQNIL
jgi:hypothetical protein